MTSTSSLPAPLIFIPRSGFPHLTTPSTRYHEQHSNLVSSILHQHNQDPSTPPPLSSLSEPSPTQLERDFIMQGELLQFYVVIAPERQRVQPWLVPRAIREARAASSSSLSSSSPPTASSSSSSSSSRSPSPSASSGPCEDVRFLETTDEHVLLTVTLRDSHAVSDQNQSVLAHFHADSHASPASTGAVAEPRSFVFELEETHDIVYGVEMVVSISNSQMSPTVAIHVSLAPVPSTARKLQVSSLSERTATIRTIITQTRTVAPPPSPPPLLFVKHVQLCQPLQITAKDSACGSKVCLCICVQNVDSTIPIEVTDLEVHLNRTRYRLLGHNRTDFATVPLERFFKLYYDQLEFPIVLQPGEQHNTIAFIEPLYCSPAELAMVSENLRTLFSVKWTCEYLADSPPIVVQRKAAWKRPAHHEIMFCMKNASPVPVNETFTTYVTVSNYGVYPVDFTLLMLPQSHPLVMESQAQRGRSPLHLSDDDVPPSRSTRMPSPARWRAVSVPADPVDPTADSVSDPGMGDRAAAWSPPSGPVTTTVTGSQLLSLESSVHLGVIEPQFSRSVSVHFIALREGLLELKNLFLFDELEGRYYRLQEPPNVFAIHANSLSTSSATTFE